MTHPKILPPILLLPLHDPQHARNPTTAPRCEPRMKILPIMAISDIDTLVSCYRVGDHSRGGVDTVFPFLLHLCVHYEEGVVGEVDGDGAAFSGAIGVLGEDSADTEFPADA